MISWWNGLLHSNICHSILNLFIVNAFINAQFWHCFHTIFIAFHIHMYPQWGNLSSHISFAGSCFLLSRKGSMLSSIRISSSMPRIIYPLSAMVNIPGILSLVFKNPDSLVSSTSEIEPTNTGDAYVWNGTIRCTRHKRLGSIVVFVLTPCRWLQVQSEGVPITLHYCLWWHMCWDTAFWKSEEVFQLLVLL